jgi:NADPH:quinone reductase-like Zn-dependent oxidoreductase
MKAIMVRGYGGLKDISLEEVPAPVPADDEILVRVQAAGVNPVDWKIAGGMLKDRQDVLPYIPGGDFSGMVTAAGNAVTKFKIGDAVFGMTSTPNFRIGAFAEFVAVKAADAAFMPKNLDMVAAAAVPLAALTAWQALFDRAELQAGQRILIHAGAGGVGGFAIQFARHAGAKITTTTSAANADYVRGLGADEVIDYRAVPFENAVKDLDAVLDLIGGDTQARSYKVLRPGGVLVNAWGTIMQDEAAAAGVRGVKVAVTGNGAQLTEIARLIETGSVKMEIAKVMPLAEVQQAFALSRDGHVRGKIVLTVGE